MQSLPGTLVHICQRRNSGNGSAVNLSRQAIVSAHARPNGELFPDARNVQRGRAHPSYQSHNVRAFQNEYPPHTRSRFDNRLAQKSDGGFVVCVCVCSVRSKHTPTHAHTHNPGERDSDPKCLFKNHNLNIDACNPYPSANTVNKVEKHVF